MRTSSRHDDNNWVATTPVTIEDLATGLRSVEELPAEERRNWEARQFALARAFGAFDERPGRRKRFTKKDRTRANKIVAVSIRLESLARLSRDPRFAAWTLEKTDDGAALVNEDLLKAAAEAPLQDDGNGHHSFDADLFFAFLLKIAETDGRG